MDIQNLFIVPRCILTVHVQRLFYVILEHFEIDLEPFTKKIFCACRSDSTNTYLGENKSMVGISQYITL